ncbi:MAG: creatininase family protein [Actinomycetia bacterium]|nr:creatininase family protein [Actinomycetes bacterium]
MAARGSRRLEDLTLPQVKEMIGPSSILLLPIGSVEQHGPHLPLTTDHLIASEAAREVATRCGEELDLWLLPTLAVSKANEHAWAPGTLWLQATTLLSVVNDIAASAAATGARRLVFLNSHGGNTALLVVACREARLAAGMQTFLLHPFLPPDHGGRSATAPSGELGMGVHGGHDETSLMLHLRPDLVDMTSATRRVPDRLAGNRHVRFGGSVPFGWTSDDFGPEGHIGDPTGATAQEGRELFEGAVEMLCEQLAEIAGFDFGMGRDS